MRDEDGAAKELEQLGRDASEARCRGDVGVADSVHGGRFCGNRTGGANEAREPGPLKAVRVETDGCERDDLVQPGLGAGRLAVEDCVSGGRRHFRPGPQTPRHVG